MIKIIRENGLKKTVVMVALSTIRVWQASLAYAILAIGVLFALNQAGAFRLEANDKIEAAVYDNCLKITDYSNADLDRWRKLFDSLDRQLPEAQVIISELRAELLPPLDLEECVPPGAPETKKEN